MGGLLSHPFSPAPKPALGCKHFVSFNERTLGVRPVADNWAYACWGIEANTLVGIAGTSLVLAGQHARVCPSFIERRRVMSGLVLRARRGLIDNVRGWMLYGDYAKPN